MVVEAVKERRKASSRVATVEAKKKKGPNSSWP